VKAVALLYCLAAALAPVAEAGSVYHFDGPRQPVVTIEDEVHPWKGRVTFLGVKCFDAGLNDSINRGKAKSYLFMAMAKRVNATNIEIGGLQLLTSGSGADGSFSAEFLIPNKPVVVSQPDKSASKELGSVGATASNNNFSSSGANNLLSRKYDWTQTLDATSEAFSSGFPAKPSSQPNDTDRFCNEIAATEETVRQTFASLTSQAEKDSLLLSNEKREVSEHAAQDQQASLDRLKQYASSCLPAN